MSCAKRVSVLCVDDNPLVGEALRVMLAANQMYSWQGWLPSADTLAEVVRADPPDVVLLDVDMPGLDPLVAIEDVLDENPDVRVIVFSGHVGHDLVVRALDAGAWGYVSKNDGEEELLRIISSVVDGNMTLSPEARDAIKGDH